MYFYSPLDGMLGHHRKPKHQLPTCRSITAPLDWMLVHHRVPNMK